MHPRAPKTEGAQALGIAAGSTGMRRERVAFILNGTPAEWAVAQGHLAGGCDLTEIR